MNTNTTRALLLLIIVLALLGLPSCAEPPHPRPAPLGMNHDQQLIWARAEVRFLERECRALGIEPDQTPTYIPFYNPYSYAGN